ncbi:hypothetical protein TNCV_3290971 [Trichonephila clavipes]|nr:hypothetical protein TNCV_3290971 [Trichonephila clavipes]
MGVGARTYVLQGDPELMVQTLRVGTSTGNCNNSPCRNVWVQVTRRDTNTEEIHKKKHRTVTAGSDVVQSGRPIFDDFFQHLWPYISNNTANVVFQMVKHLRLIRINQ